MVAALWFRIVCVAAAGAVGALARWGTGLLVQNWLAKGWPWGTLIVNALGCLLFGAVMGYVKPEQAEQPAYVVVRLLLLTGFCGAYTTYSTFAFDVYELWLTRGPWPAIGNVAAQLMAGLGAVALGVALGRTLA